VNTTQTYYIRAGLRVRYWSHATYFGICVYRACLFPCYILPNILLKILVTKRARFDVRTRKEQNSQYWFSGDAGTYTVCLATVLVLIYLSASAAPHYDVSNRVSTTLTLSVTTSFTTTDIAATTEVSITEQTSYATEVVHSYGTITATQYVYLESSTSNGTPNTHSTTPSNDLLSPSLVAALSTGQLPDSRLFLLVGSGVVILILALVLVVGRGSYVNKDMISLDVDKKLLLNHINDRKGASSGASKDLRISTGSLGEPILGLKADERLEGTCRARSEQQQYCSTIPMLPAFSNARETREPASALDQLTNTNDPD